MKILVIGASSSSTSINRQLAIHAAGLIPNSTHTVLDLNEFEMPIYSSDREEREGIPKLAHQFAEAIAASDAIVLSLAEHNGSYTAAFKNILDWASRAQQGLWAQKPMALLATSPGGRGGATILEAAKNYLPHMGADIRATFSLPSFYDHFDSEKGITDPELTKQLNDAIATLNH